MQVIKFHLAKDKGKEMFYGFDLDLEICFTTTK